jgi:hypothetical protein
MCEHETHYFWGEVRLPNVLFQNSGNVSLWRKVFNSLIINKSELPYRARWHSGSGYAVCFYSGGTGFESLSGYRLSALS